MVLGRSNGFLLEVREVATLRLLTYLNVNKKVSSISLTQISVSARMPWEEDWTPCEFRAELDDLGDLKRGIRCTLWRPMARKHTDAEAFARSSDDDLVVALPCGRNTTLYMA